MNNESVISLEHVTFGYNGSPVVEDVSLTVNHGDYVGIIGPNGSGKTTLLRLILGILKSQSGKIELFGQPIIQFNDWTRIGYIPQKATQLDTRFPITVREVISLGRIAKKGLFGKLNKKDNGVIEKAVSLVGLSELRDTLITDLSGGQQQRVFIAKALASEPDLLILDEPTVGVDVESQEKFYELLSELHKAQGKTIIIVSHDIDVIANEVHTIVCINKHLVYHGSPKEFIKEDYLEKLYGHDRKFIIHGH